MSNQKQDPLVETLMQLAASAAPLIRRARESGMFRNDGPGKADEPETVDATVVKPAPASAAVPADVEALQTILVRQALRISELESEVAALKAKQKAQAQSKPKPKPKPAAGKRAAK